jgi:hypothetical protein
VPLYYVKQENSSQGFQPLGCQAENLVIGELVNYVISKVKTKYLKPDISHVEHVVIVAYFY